MRSQGLIHRDKLCAITATEGGLALVFMGAQRADLIGALFTGLMERRMSASIERVRDELFSIVGAAANTGFKATAALGAEHSAG